MSTASNQTQPPFLGTAVPNWTPREIPHKKIIEGRTCRLEKLSADKHGTQLFNANATDKANRIWNYLPYGPFSDEQDYTDWLRSIEKEKDPMFYAIIDTASDRAVGVASYLRLDPASGSIEVGHINYSPLLQNTVTATEAMYLMMKQVFELGYRRYEWKCNALNTPSCRAAQRLGFSFEGTFRQATVVKNHNRDTSWFSIIDSEWPALQAAFEQWLGETNFDSDGQQRSSLSALTNKAVPGRTQP